MARILTFGAAKERISEDILSNWKGNSVGELRSFITENFPEMNDLPSYMIAVNEEYAEDADTISESDVIAIIPPVSGG